MSKTHIKPAVFDPSLGTARNPGPQDILEIEGADSLQYPLVPTVPALVVVNGGTSMPTNSGYYLIAVAPSAGLPANIALGDVAWLNTSSVWVSLFPIGQLPSLLIDTSGNTWVKDSSSTGWILNKQVDDNITTNSNVWSANKISSYVTQQLLNAPSLPSVKFATTADDSLSGLAARDGYTPVAGDVGLFKNQTNNDNGFWIAPSSGAWTRAYYNTSTGLFAPITTQTTYSQLNIQGGIVNVLNGTTNKNLQFQINVVNTAATFTNSVVYITQTTKIPLAGNNCKVIDNTVGNNSFNGSWAFPYATLTYALTSSGLSFPATLMVPASGSAFTDALTFTSAYSNCAIITHDSSTVSGKTSISGVQTYATGNTRVGFKGTTHSTGASTPFVFQAGNLMRHWFENVAITTSNTSLMSFDVSNNNFLNLRNIDATGSIFSTIPLPAFTSAFTLNIYNQASRLPISGTGSSTTTINIFNSDESHVRIYPTFTGTINWQGKTFGLPIGSTAISEGIITSQAQLNTVLAWTTDTSYDGYYAISGFTPTAGSFSAGSIFGKQTAAGVATEVWYARTYRQAPGILSTTTGQLIYQTGTNTWGSSTSTLSSYGHYSVTPTSTNGTIPLTIKSGNLAVSSNYITLSAGVTYRLFAALEYRATYAEWQWQDSTGTILANSTIGWGGSVNSADAGSIVPAAAVITPNANLQVKLVLSSIFGYGSSSANKCDVFVQAIGANQPVTNVTQFGSVVSTVAGGTSISTSSSTATTIMTINIPSAGVWDVTYVCRASATAAQAYALGGLFLAGALVPNSEVMIIQAAGGSTVAQSSGTGKAQITTTGPATYTVGLWSGGGTATTGSDSNGRSYASWTQVGNTPVANTNALSPVRVTAIVQAGTAVPSTSGTYIFNGTPTGGLPTGATLYDVLSYNGTYWTSYIPASSSPLVIYNNADSNYYKSSGTTWTILGVSQWVATGSYALGQVVLNNNSFYYANSAIASNTAFVVGTTGATWSPVAASNTTLAVSNLATGGNLCTAAQLNIYSTFNVTQTTALQTMTLPVPLGGQNKVTVLNTTASTVTFTMYGISIPAGYIADFYYTGSTWTGKYSATQALVDPTFTIPASPAAVVSGQSVQLAIGNLQGQVNGLEVTANKTVGTLETNKTSDVKFPTVKAVYDWSMAKIGTKVWNSTDTYAQNEFVSRSGSIYKALSAVPANQDPTASPTYWRDVLAAAGGILAAPSSVQVTPNMTGATTSGCTYSASSQFDSTTYAAWRTGQATPSAWATFAALTDYWLQIAFTSPTQFDTVLLGGRAGEYPVDMSFAVSNDTITWIVLRTARAFASDTATGKLHYLGSQKWKYFRIHCHNSNSAAMNPGLSVVKLFKQA